MPSSASRSQSSKTDLTNQTITSPQGSLTRSKQQANKNRRVQNDPSPTTTTSLKMVAPRQHRSTGTQMCLLVCMLLMGLASRSEVLAWHFNYQPEPMANQQQQQQQNLSPQPYGNLNLNQHNNNNNFYQPPANQFVPGNQFHNNQVLSQLMASSQSQQHQQFLTPSTSANGASSVNLLGPLAGSFGGPPMFVAANKISSSQEPSVSEASTGGSSSSFNQGAQRTSGADSVSTVAAIESTTSSSETNSKSQSEPTAMVQLSRDESTASSALDTTGSLSRQSEIQASANKQTQSQSMTTAASEPRRTGPETADHNVVRSTAQPSPPGKILEASGRDLSPVPTSNHQHQTQPSQPNQITSRAASLLASLVSGHLSESKAELSPTTTTTTTTTTKAPFFTTTTTAKQEQSSEAPMQMLKPIRRGAQQANNNNINSKDPLNKLEQQIINQHARASYTNSHRSEPTSTTASPTVQPQQQLRLLPNKLRDHKLLNSFLSLSDHHSGADTQDSSSANVDGRQQKPRPKPGGVLSSLAESFTSGISSRSSIVKAAMGDNKLARTLSTVGKTIGGNKYVAGAGIAAALAALGLTVSKLLVPSYSSSPYSKLGANYGEHMIPSGSIPQPSYYGDLQNPYSGVDLSPGRLSASMNGHLVAPGLSNGNYANSETMLAAAANNQPFDTTVGWLSQSQTTMAGNHFGGPTSDSFRQGRPTQSPFTESANGHYSSFYSGQPDMSGEQYQPTGETYARPTTPGVVFEQPSNPPQQQQQQPPNQRYGSYVSGSPSPSIYPAPPQYSSYSPDSSPTYSTPMGQQNQNQNFNSNQQQPAYDQLQPSLANDQFNSDQILAAASSEYPQRFPSAPSNPRRSGAVRMKLDEAGLQLLGQQLQTADLAMSRMNLEHLRAFRDQLAADQSNSMEQSASEQKVSQQRFLPLANSGPARPEYMGSSSFSSSEPAVSSSNKWKPTMVASSAPDSASALKSGRLADVAASAVTNKSDYKGQSKQLKQQQFVTRNKQQQQLEQQTMAGNGGDLGGPIRAGPVQTGRNEPSPSSSSNGGSNIRPPAYLLIAQNSSQSQSQWQVADLSLPKAASQSARLSNGASGKQQQQQSRLQPPRVSPTVDKATTKSDQLDSAAAAVTGQDHGPRSGGWQSFGVARQAESSGADGQQGSLSPVANESDSLVAVAADDASDEDNRSSSPMTDGNDDGQQPAATRLRRTPSANSGPSSSSSSSSASLTKDFRATWRQTGTVDPEERRPAGMRDYGTPVVVMAAPKDRHSSAEGKSGASRRLLGSENVNNSGDEMEDDGSQQLLRQRHQQQRQEELLQVVANSMGTNLIQLGQFGNGNEAAGSGAEYQIEAANINNNSSSSTSYNDNNSDNSFETTTVSSDNKATKPNKLIEAKANPNANNADSSVSIEPKPNVTGARPSATSAQHDHHDRHAGHRSPNAVGDKLAQQQHDGDNVVVELLPNDNEAGKQSTSYGGQSPPTSSSDGSLVVVAGGARGRPQVADDEDDNETETTGGGQVGKQRAFRGLVAGSIGAS